MPSPESHCFICITLLGLSSDVILHIVTDSSFLEISSSAMASSTIFLSMAIPLSQISWSSQNSSQTKSGTGNFASFCWMDCSTTTSLWLYALNRFHFSISCSGRFLVLPPLLFVALHGTQKYRIKSLPSFSFCSSRPNTAPTPASDRGSPM